MAVTLRPVTIDAGINMVKVNTIHHNCNYKNQVNEQDMDILLSFLRRFADGKILFSETIQKETTNLTANPIPTTVSPRFIVPQLRGIKRAAKQTVLTAISVLG